MKKSNVYSFLKYLVLILMAMFMLFPFYWMFISSFKSGSEIVMRPPTIFPENFTLKNYKIVFSEVPIWKYAINSLLVVCICVVSVLFTTITGAFALSKLQLPGKNIIIGMLVSLMMVPFELLSVTNYTTIVKLDLYDNILALFVPFMSSIFYTLLLKNHFDMLPNNLYYSVQVDGGTDLSYLLKVLIPSSKSVLVSISLFTLISSWNSFMWPLLVIKSKANRTITFGVYAFVSDGGEHFELIMALSVIVVLPMILVFLIMRKYIVNGVSFGGTKG